MEKLSRLKFFLIAILCWLLGVGICFIGAVLNMQRVSGGLFIFGMSFLGAGWIMGDCCNRRLNDIACQNKWIRFVVYIFSFFYLIFPIVIVLALFKSKSNVEAASNESSSSDSEKIKLGLCSPCRRALLIATFLYFLFGVGLVFYLNNEGWVFDTPEETAVPMYCIILLILILFTFGVGQLMFYKPFKRLMLWVKTGK